MDRDRVRSLVLRCACSLVVLATAAAPAEAQVVSVPLDRSGQVPGTLQLEVRSEVGLRDRGGTLLVLDGRGQGRATRRLTDYAYGLAPLGARRTVTFDMRGTGATRIACDALAHEPSPAKAVAECAAQLGPRRARFTVADDVADAEAVRAALGIERMTLYGFDYGAGVALAYAAAHPERVERVVVDSPAGPGIADATGRSTFAAIRRVAASLCRRSCRFTHDPLAELTTLLEQLERSPLRVRAYDGHGRRDGVEIGAAQLRDLLLASDVSIVARVMWPAAVHAALDGDPALLAQLVRTTARASSLRTPGGALRLARACAGRETTSSAAGPDLAADAFAPVPFALAVEVTPAGVCATWPDPPTASVAALPSQTPVLVRSGTGSITAPLEDAQALVSRLPAAQLLALPAFGHEIVSWSVGPDEDCPDDALRAFAHGRPVRACRGAAIDVAWPATPPRSLADLAPRRRLPARVGRTLRAAELTLLDAFVTLADVVLIELDDQPDRIPGVHDLRHGGLRGGSVRIAEDGFHLRRYSYVPGVTLTGVFGEDDAWLRIGGSAAAHGRLRLLRERSCGSRSCFAGRLGGRSVQLPIPGSG